MKKIKEFLAVLGLSVMAFQQNVLATVDFKPEDIETGSDGTFDEIITTIKGIGASAFNLEQVFGKIVFMLSLGLCALCFMIYRSGIRKDENKSAVMNVFLGGGILFAIVPITQMVIEIFK